MSDLSDRNNPSRQFYDMLLSNCTGHLQRLLTQCRALRGDLPEREAERVIMAWIKHGVTSPYVCQQCGYDMRATPERCPECGCVCGRTEVDLARPHPLQISSKFNPATLKPLLHGQGESGRGR